jgi:hypothetical protein
MDWKKHILTLLLDRYERSGHCLPGQVSNRGVLLNMTRGECSDYCENDPVAADINHAVEALAAAELVTFKWRKGYEGWLLGSVYLNLDCLDAAYEKAGRIALSQSADNLSDILAQAMTGIQTPWKLRFLEDELASLQKKLRPSRLLPRSIAEVKAILKVLHYTEKGP